MRVSDFTYELPEAAIAQSAVEPRHSSRLLDSRDMSDHTFIELADLLEPGDLVVVNETRVRRARVEGTRRGTGGKVELPFLDSGADGRSEEEHLGAASALRACPLDTEEVKACT